MMQAKEAAYAKEFIAVAETDAQTMQLAPDTETDTHQPASAALPWDQGPQELDSSLAPPPAPMQTAAPINSERRRSGILTAISMLSEGAPERRPSQGAEGGAAESGSPESLGEGMAEGGGEVAERDLGEEMGGGEGDRKGGAGEAEGVLLTVSAWTGKLPTDGNGGAAEEAADGGAEEAGDLGVPLSPSRMSPQLFLGIKVLFSPLAILDL